MFIDSNSLKQIVQLELDVIEKSCPDIYNWIKSNNKVVGMHMSKFLREIRKALDKTHGTIDLNKLNVYRVAA